MRPIVFDFGGVLIDWNPFYLYRKVFADDQAIKQFLDEIDFHNWNLQLDAGRPFNIAVDELCKRYPQHCEPIRMYDQHWEETLSEPIWPTVEVLTRLHDQGHPLYGLSNWSREKFDLVRSRYSFFDLFAEIVLSGDVGWNKPDERIFDVLLRRAGYPASEMILVDDSMPNIQAAARLGFDALHFTGAEKLRADLSQRGILV